MKRSIIVAASILFAGCSSIQEASEEKVVPGATDDLQRYEAEFRPSDHDPNRGGTLDSTVSQDRRGEGRQKDNAAQGAEQDLVQGFRVQIYSTTNIDIAKSKKAEAESYFPRELFYMQYDPPTYKIRGGNFLQRYEADRFARMAIDKGFAGSWTVPEKVLKQPPPSQR